MLEKYRKANCQSLKLEINFFKSLAPGDSCISNILNIFLRLYCEQAKIREKFRLRGHGVCVVNNHANMVSKYLYSIVADSQFLHSVKIEFLINLLFAVFIF